MIHFEYLMRRLLSSLLVIAGVITLTFFVARASPSDPATLYAGPRASQERLADIRIQLGLDRSLPEQYVGYWGQLLRGDLGESYRTKRPIIDDLRIFMPATLELVVTAYFLAVTAGIGLGVMAAARQRGAFDRLSSAAVILGASAPVFLLAMLGQQVFFNWLHWLPLNGRLDSNVALAYPIRPITGFYLIDAAVTGNWVAWHDAVAHLVLPLLMVASYPMCVILRMTRNTLVHTLAESFIVSARSRGLPARFVLLRHALRHALPPVLTLAGLTFAYAITGTLFVELLFRWPGVGAYVTTAIVSRDFPVILAVTLVSTCLYVVVMITVEMAQIALDPRV